MLTTEPSDEWGGPNAEIDIGLGLIARLAAHLLRVSAALVTIGAEQGIWHRGAGGRDWAAMAEDLRHDIRQGLRFCAEVPIVASGGWRIGAICVFDSEARQDLATVEQAVLADLAALAAMQYEGRRQAAAPPSKRSNRRLPCRLCRSPTQTAACPLNGWKGWVTRT